MNLHTINCNLIEDEYPRKDINIDDLKKLDPVFKDNGTVTSGNSSGLNDGAASVVLMKRKDAESKGIEPMAKIKSWSNTGVDPSIMGIGPVSAIKLAIKKANWEIKEVELFEINEAFAAQSIAVVNDTLNTRRKSKCKWRRYSLRSSHWCLWDKNSCYSNP